MQRVVALKFGPVIPDDEAVTQPSRHIRTGELERLLSQLRHAGFQSVSSRAFRAWQQGRRALPERTVALTFDDGYASHLHVVAPLLLRYKFTGTFFVSLERIGQPGYLSWEQLRKLIFLKMEIGSHGVSDHALTDLPRAQLVHELVQAREDLQRQLGVPIQAFSAPRGFWNPTVAQVGGAGRL